MYPRGARQVQCSLCGTLNDAQQANQVGHITCGSCQLVLVYSFGARSVKCAVCNHVTPVPSSAAANVTNTATTTNTQSMPYHQSMNQRPNHQSNQQQTAPTTTSVQSSSKPVEAVLVENPPTLDESGNEVQNVALGLVKK